MSVDKLIIPLINTRQVLNKYKNNRFIANIQSSSCKNMSKKTFCTDINENTLNSKLINTPKYNDLHENLKIFKTNNINDDFNKVSISAKKKYYKSDFKEKNGNF